MIVRKNVVLLVVSLAVINCLFIYAKTPLKQFGMLEKTINPVEPVEEVAVPKNLLAEKLSLYDSLHLGEQGLSREAFDYALQGYEMLKTSGKLKNDRILSIVDFSLASSKKRLFVIDLSNNEVLFNTYVAHGRNSGREKAVKFSNQPESFMSSLGFYITGDTYSGKHGFSLRLLGEEKGINDNANSRAIVMHSAAYVSEGVAKMQGFVGRSLGCPALPEELNKPIIDKIKNGSCLFLYSPDQYYVAHSAILKKMA